MGKRRYSPNTDDENHWKKRIRRLEKDLKKKKHSRKHHKRRRYCVELLLCFRLETATRGDWRSF